MKFLKDCNDSGKKKKNNVLISELYHEHVNKLFAFGKTFTNQDEIVKDCIQDLFIYLVDNPGKLLKIKNIKAYMFTMLRNELLRTLKRRNMLNFYSDPEHVKPDDKFYSINTLMDHFDINEQSMNKKKVVNEVLSSLSHKQRTIIYLRYHEQLSYEDICKILSINYQSARTLIYRTIQKIRKGISEKKLTSFN